MTRLNLAFHPGTVLLCLILFLLVIFGLRAADSFWLDEYWSLYHAGGVIHVTTVQGLGPDTGQALGTRFRATH